MHGGGQQRPSRERGAQQGLFALGQPGEGAFLQGLGVPRGRTEQGPESLFRLLVPPRSGLSAQPRRPFTRVNSLGARGTAFSALWPRGTAPLLVVGSECGLNQGDSTHPDPRGSGRSAVRPLCRLDSVKLVSWTGLPDAAGRVVQKESALGKAGADLQP